MVRAQRYKGSKAPRHKGTKAQRHKGTKAQRHKGSKAQKHKGTKAWLKIKELHSSGASSVTHPWPHTSRGTLDKKVNQLANWFPPFSDLKMGSWTWISLLSKNVTFSPSHILCHQQTCLEFAPRTCGRGWTRSRCGWGDIMCNWRYLRKRNVLKTSHLRRATQRPTW